MEHPVRKLVYALAGVILLAVAGGLYAFGGFSSPETHIDYRVTITDPASGLAEISMTITPPPFRPWLHLYLHESQLDNGENRTAAVRASRSGHTIPVWRTLPTEPDLITVWTGFRRAPVTLTYRINPLWMKGPDSPRSYLGAEFGYLRGMTTLFSPVTRQEALSKGDGGPVDAAGSASLRFILPEGWSVISPLADDAPTTTSLLRNIYFGVGPFAITSITEDGSTFVLGVYRGLGDERIEEYITGVPRLFSTMTAAMGFSPAGKTGRWALTILPEEPIHGGSSGTGSLVTGPELYILSHEMFHWWNGETVGTTPDANWIKEGFTKYYEGKMLYRAGLWDDDDYAYHLGKPGAKLRRGDDPVYLDLVRSSDLLVKENREDEYDHVYFGGMSAAWYIDCELEAQEKSLDDIWRELRTVKPPVTTAVFLDRLASLGGQELADRCAAMVHGESELAIP